ncbi:MAG: NINE protein [Saprospirales bacterium]|nr:MAG: NINE protein [Saprospirales bacterium]
MKNKNTATLLAFFLGWVGAHRFYLGQYVLGFLYILLFFTFGISFIIALIDFFGFLTMRRERFDYLYNRMYFDNDYKEFLSRRKSFQKGGPPKMVKKEARKRARKAKSTRDVVLELKKEGKSHYENYEYEQAVELFEKVLEINSRDAAIHFNLACCFSLLENKGRAFRHLKLAVENGFDDFGRFKEHRGLAWLRVQDEWDDLMKTNFKRIKLLEAEGEDLLNSKDTSEDVNRDAGTEKDDKILVQLRKLKDLRDRGLISDLEFSKRKEALL